MMAIFWIELACCAIALGITINVLGNLRAFRRLADFARSAGDEPFVSVLVPARDEERSIAACLDSLIGQDYPRYEVIVLDDGSTDRTAEIVRQCAACSRRMRLVTGGPLAGGWMGKAFACDQLSAEANGDMLIFTDADTVHGPTMIRSVVGAMTSGADLVTAFPEQIVRSWSEWLAVPFMLFTVWAFLPVGRVWSDRSSRFVAANGQLLAFTRSAYARIGGHASVRRSVLDDVDLARRAKQLGLRVRLTDGVGTVRTRMYHGFGEVWRGFSKNALALTGGSVLGAAACATALLLLYVVPLVILAVGAIDGRSGWTWRSLPALLIGLMAAQVVIVGGRTRRPLWSVALHPASVILLIVILGNSVCWRLRGHGEWKGRPYDASASAGARLPAREKEPR
jgi:chlorobactene glucosyltransferase